MMENSDLYKNLLTYLETHLFLQVDKPEESYESTLRALWLTVFGNPVSVEQARTQTLPKLNKNQTQLLYALIEKRVQGEPLAYITGFQQFMGIELLTGKEALIPRKETEILGYTALKILKETAEKQDSVTVFDLCCGAGNLTVALAKNEPKAHIFASDLSENAVELTKRNIKFHQLENRIKANVGSVLEPFDSQEFYGKVDLIVCNPPYISDTKVLKMAPEISEHEPAMAFKGGGMLGLHVIQDLIKNAQKFLKKQSWLAFEVGLGQGEYIMKLCSKTLLYSEIDSASDKNGNIRVVLARK